MPGKIRNPQMFAFSRPPPEQIQIAGRAYRLVRVFKHDFWAATCLYETSGEAEFPRLVVKRGRMQPFCGLPLGWYGRWLAAHEEGIYRLLEGVEGVPRWVGRLGEAGFAIEFIEAKPLDHLDKPPDGFFDRLREVFYEIHGRGVAYCDANKRSNILVTDDGRPFLVDFQISIRERSDWPWPLRQIVRRVVAYLAGKDLYHIYKHKRRLAPQELRPDEAALSVKRSGLHWLHRKLTKPYRSLRRKFLQKLFAKGALRSPTAELEDHYQPEKQTWRKN